MSTGLDTSDSDVPGHITVRARNIGGIDETETTLDRGVTALSGRNATNRTSLLQAIMAALGSERTSLKADAKEGSATLEIGSQTYQRTLKRQNGTVVSDGDPYLDDPELADLFAFLLESNEARRAVARGDDLRSLIMRPVNTEQIQTDIERAERRKGEIDTRLDELESLNKQLPSLEEKRTRLSGEIESLTEELEAATSELEETNANVDEKREEKEELEDKLDELRATRSELERTRQRIETERNSIDALEDERDELDDRLESMAGSDASNRGTLEAEIEALQDEKASLTDEISQLQSTIQFNERLLSESSEYLERSDSTTSSDDPTDQLLEESETVTCWTCGSTVPESQIQTTIDQLQTARKNRLQERTDVSADLEERQSELAKIEERQTERRRATRRRDSIGDEIDERTERLEDLQDERSALTDSIDDLETEIEALENESYAEILDQHREVNQVEFTIGRKEDERAAVESEISEIESKLSEREGLEAEREDVAEELTDLRTRIEQIEANAVEAFNEHMENVLEILAYENLDRIWIDRSTREAREGRRTVTKSTFDLKIVRTTEEGSAYEDSVDHLSESEREVTGLVFALAGYLVHEVYRTVPFMLLDSLEAIDSERIADLVAYFESYVPYLVVALLVEDAQALEEPDRMVTEI